MPDKSSPHLDLTPDESDILYQTIYNGFGRYPWPTDRDLSPTLTTLVQRGLMEPVKGQGYYRPTFYGREALRKQRAARV